MEQISFYLDEHIHRAVAEGLRRRGVNVLTVQEAGRAALSDSEQFEICAGGASGDGDDGLRLPCPR